MKDLENKPSIIQIDEAIHIKSTLIFDYQLLGWRIDLDDIQAKLQQYADDIWDARYPIEDIILELPNLPSGRIQTLFGIPTRVEVNS